VARRQSGLDCLPIISKAAGNIQADKPYTRLKKPQHPGRTSPLMNQFRFVREPDEWFIFINYFMYDAQGRFIYMNWFRFEPMGRFVQYPLR
jgi:hypothetical protein